VVEIHNGVVRPELVLDFLAGYDLARTLNQHSQDLEGLFPKKNPAVTADSPDRAQFTRLQVKLKPANPYATLESEFRGTFIFGHRGQKCTLTGKDENAAARCFYP